MSTSSPEYAVVSGAASGIGRAVALRLAKRGAQIALIDVNADGLPDVLREVERLSPGSETLIASVADSAAIRAAVESFARRRGRIDTVVCCAGVLRMGKLLDMPERDWHEVIAVNLTGTYLVAHQSMPWLLERGGSFIAISSDAGTQGATGYSAYCASKHGLLGLIKCLALEYGPRGVRSNAICPSFVETPMAEAAFASAGVDERRRYQELVPLGRFARAEEIAAIAAHLSSPDASYVNGMAYAVDGGATAGYFCP